MKSGIAVETIGPPLLVLDVKCLNGCSSTLYMYYPIKASALNVMLFFLCRDATGKFPDYPDEEEGGSAAIFKKREKPEVS